MFCVCVNVSETKVFVLMISMGAAVATFCLVQARKKTETKFNLKLADFRKLFCLNQEAGQLIQFTIKTFQITNGTLDIP